jgi:hypothetical protein
MVRPVVIPEQRSTGISVAPGYVLTSLHVVGARALADPDAPVRVVHVGGERPLPATITYADGELDLAMPRSCARAPACRAQLSFCHD